MATNYILEQYKLLTSSFNDEITRFWSRFNILFGVEIIGLIGILNSLKILSSNIVLFRLTLILMLLYSISTFLIVWRGFMMHQNILKTLLKFEQKSEGKLEILRLSKSNSKIPIGFNKILPFLFHVFSQYFGFLCFYIMRLTTIM